MAYREGILGKLTRIFPQYRFAWSDSKGDFSGREHAIDIFGVPLDEQKNFLRSFRLIREEVEKELGGRPIFIFRKDV